MLKLFAFLRSSLLTNSLLLWVSSTLFLLVLFLGYGGQAIAAQSEESVVVAQIEAYLDPAVENDTFSGAILVARDGEILLSEGYGLANREWDISNMPDTKFRIGSITKQFTAIAILKLQERGLLSVQASICEYLDDCPEAWQEISLHHLLTHTSGIPEHVGRAEFMEAVATGASPDTIIEWFRNEPLDFAPGERWSYSNSGYILLGEIIHEVSGNSYQTFLDENIFEPLGMTNTGYDRNLSIIEHRAEGYASIIHKAEYINMSIPYAAGGLYSTVEDLYLWDQALYNSQLISQESWDTMLAAAVSSYAAERLYGYGLEIVSESQHPSISHGGNLPGFASFMTHFTDDNTTVIVLSNLETAPVESIVSAIAEIVFDAD
jgi:CubicO group peptidase (beta-lactamase class C family)